MNWWQKFLVSLASLAIMFVAGHFLWPARELVEIPGKVVLDSAATQALEVRLDSVRAGLRSVRAVAMQRLTDIARARILYGNLAHRLDSLEHVPSPVIDEWPAAVYDTTVQRVTPLEITIGDSVERREVLQEVRLSGEYVLPPFNVFRNVALEVTPSTIYYSRQLPGKTVEKVEVIRWPWLPVVAGYLGGTIITTLVALLISGASH